MTRLLLGYILVVYMSIVLILTLILTLLFSGCAIGHTECHEPFTPECTHAYERLHGV